MPTLATPRVRKRVPEGRVYESEAPLQQKHFSHRRKTVRVNRDCEGGREHGAGRTARFASQQTLTQIDFVHVGSGTNAQYGDGSEGQYQIEDACVESRPTKRRRKANSRRISKLAGQETLTQLDFVKIMRQSANGTDYDVWLEETAGDPEHNQEERVKVECPDENDGALKETASPTSKPAAGHYASKKSRVTRKKCQRGDISSLSPITVPARVPLNSDSATRSPLSDLSPNKPPSKTSRTKVKNKAYKGGSRKNRIPAIRESLSPSPPQPSKRKQILAIANSDSEDPDENSDNNETLRSDDTTIIIRRQDRRPYSAYNHSKVDVKNQSYTCRSPLLPSSSTTLSKDVPTTNGKAFKHEEILDSEPARAAFSQAPGDVTAEDLSPTVSKVHASMNILSSGNQPDKFPDTLRTDLDQSEHLKVANLSPASASASTSTSTSTSQSAREQTQKQPLKDLQRQDLEQSQFILPTPLSQATTVDPDTLNASSPSARSRRSIQLPPSSLCQGSSPDHQGQQRQEIQQHHHQHRRHQVDQYIPTKPFSANSSDSNLSSDGLERRGDNANESYTHQDANDNGTYDLDEGGTGGYESCSLPSSPFRVVTAESLLPESLMAFSIPRPPSFPRML